MTRRIYELTTNWMEGYLKYYVVGLKTKSEAKRLAKRVFGKFYWNTDGAVSYYDDYSKKWKGRVYTKLQFLKLKKDFEGKGY